MGAVHHGIDAGYDDKSLVQEKVVGGRAGGSGDDDAVARKGGDELGVADLDGEGVGHASDGALGDDDVVESLPVLEGFAVAVSSACIMARVSMAACCCTRPRVG